MSGRPYLRHILEAHRARAASDSRDLESLRTSLQGLPPCRGFRAALASGRDLAVIAEIKRRSPSKGDLDPGLDPAVVAMEYEAGGATCVSVLTDQEFFGGSADDLDAARRACSLPVLRKDFTVCPADVLDARAIGADAVLLIAAALDDEALAVLGALAVEVGLDVLVEVHDDQELERALSSGADVVGVNQRDLSTFTVDHDRALRMAAAIPVGVVAVAESGIRGADDARRLADAGYDAVLVGESLVRSPDRQAALAELSGLPVGRRQAPARGGR